jgi:hypothetical protein
MAMKLTSYQSAFKYEFSDAKFIWYNLQVLRLIVGQRLKSLNVWLPACLVKGKWGITSRSGTRPLGMFGMRTR